MANNLEPGQKASHECLAAIKHLPKRNVLSKLDQMLILFFQKDVSRTVCWAQHYFPYSDTVEAVTILSFIASDRNVF